MPAKRHDSWLNRSFIGTVLALCLLMNSVCYATQSLEGIQVFTKNAASAQKKAETEILTRFKTADNLWDLLGSEFSLRHYENHPTVQENIDWFMHNQEFLMNTANRASPYLFFIHQQVKKRELPIELVLVPIIESGYNPFTLSTAGAAGIWQMMPETASGFGVKQDWWYDGRRDVVASTKAALDYLTYLFDFFDGNSLLAIAAYNTGEGSVLSAIRRNIQEGKSTDFWSLPLSHETRTYVPRLLALATIIAHPQTYHIRFPAVRNAPYLAQVDVGEQIDLKRAAHFAGMSLKQMEQLNPGYNRLVTHPNGPYKLVLPIEKVKQFMSQLAIGSSLKQQIDWIQYKVKSRDTLESLARQFNTTTTALREMNHLKKAALKDGMKLVIPRTLASNSKLEEKFAENKVLENYENTLTVKTSNEVRPAATLPLLVASQNNNEVPKQMLGGDTLYIVKEADTVEKIAAHYKLDPKVIYAANKLEPSASLRPGDQLLLPTHLQADLKADVSTANVA